MRRRRAARKNSDSGVSVGSSVGLCISENSMDKEINKDLLTWYPRPEVRLDLSLSKTVPPESPVVDKCEKEMAEMSDDDFTFTITANQNGRTVNGQQLVIQPVVYAPESGCSYISSEEEEVDTNSEFVWNRKAVDYKLVEVTSKNHIFKGATMDYPYETYNLMYSLCDDLFDPVEDWLLEDGTENSNIKTGAGSDKYADTHLLNYFSDGDQYKGPESSGNIVSPPATYLSEGSIIQSPSRNHKRRKTDFSQFDLKSNKSESAQNVEPQKSDECQQMVKALQNNISQKTFKIPKLMNYEKHNYQHQLDDDQLSIFASPDLEDELESDLQPGSSGSVDARESFLKAKKTNCLNTKIANNQKVYISWDEEKQRAPNERVDKNWYNSNGTANIELTIEDKSDGQINSTDDNLKISYNEMFNNFNDNYLKHFGNKSNDGVNNVTQNERENKIVSNVPRNLNVMINNVIPGNNGKILQIPTKSNYRNNDGPPQIGNYKQLNFSNWNNNHSSGFNPNNNWRNDFCSSSTSTNNLCSNNSRLLLNPRIDKPNEQYFNKPPNNQYFNKNMNQDIASRQSNHNENNFPSSDSCPNTNIFSENNQLNCNLDGQQPNFERNQNWNGENQDHLPRKMNSDVHKMITHMCRKFSSCRLVNCRFSHKIATYFDDVLSNAPIRDVQIATKYILTKCYDSFNREIIPKILTYHSKQKNVNEILNMTTNIIGHKIMQYDTKLYLLKQVVKSIMDSDENEYDFNRAIKDIIMYNGIKGCSTELILNVIIDKKDFLADCSEIISELMRYREKCPSLILNALLKECVRIKNYEIEIKTICYRCVVRILMNNVSNQKINLSCLDTFTRILVDMGLEEFATSLRTVFPPFYSFESSSSGDVPVRPVNDLLENFHVLILERNLEGLANAFKSNKYHPQNLIHAFASIHEKKTITNSVLISICEELINILDYPKTEGNLRLAIETVFFNLVPVLDREKDYDNASKIICFFKDNIIDFISVKSFSNVVPYKDNLKNEPEKLVLLLKILSRANVLNVAFNLIKMPEFNCKIQSFVKYKASIIDEFLTNALKKDLKLSWEIIEYLLSESTDGIVDELNLSKHYNNYLERKLNSKDLSTFADEFNISIKHYYKLISHDLLRAITANLSRVVKPAELLPVFDFCCSQGIYHFGTENKIILCKNMTQDEIKLVFQMFFLKALQLNWVPTNIKIVLTDAAELNSSVIEFGIFKATVKCDERSMLMRLCAALFSFIGHMDIGDDPEMLPLNVVKMCLETTRKSM